MAMRITPIAAQLGRLSIGGVSGGGSAASTTSMRLAHTSSRKRVERIEPSFEPGHGEKIYVFNHFLDGMTVYSHDPVLKATKALRQLAFNGKKLKPTKLRKDYWRPMAMIQFPEGQGEVGRSVYQRLRECKKLHEFAWDDSLLYGPSGKTLTKRERGRALNDQRANTIADMAAVLGGLGKGNKIVVSDEAAAAVGAESQSSTAAAREGEEGVEVETQESKTAAPTPPPPVVVDEGKTLVQATIWWADALDRRHAKKWTKNVTHELFDEAIVVPKEGVEDGEPQSTPAEAEAAPAQAVI